MIKKPHITPLPGTLKLHHPWALLATWFGSGLIRPAPGTMGSIAAIPFGYFALNIMGMQAFLVLVVSLFILGILAANVFDKHSDTHDSSSIVIDEVVGLWIAALPAASSWMLWGVAFVLFRFFDIVKPWPVSWADKHVSKGLGVMLDDVIAGILAMFGTAMLALPIIGVI